MAAHNGYLADWVKSAYSMELGLADVLDSQIKNFETESYLQQGISRHLQQTRHHATLLRDRLEAMGENVSGIQPKNPVSFLNGRSDGKGIDPTLHTGLIDYVTESFEIASYRAIAALAREAGDEQTARICEEILQDEMIMVTALDRFLPRPGAGSGMAEARERDLIQMASTEFTALNAHDLSTISRHLDKEFQAELSGVPGMLNKQQYEDYFKSLFAAFPDLHFEVSRIFARGDTLVTDWVGTGTHDGPLQMPASGTIAPTHKHIRLVGTNTAEFRDDKIRQVRVLYDTGALFSQLGIAQPQVGTQRQTEIDSVRIAHQNFDALNAHDLSRWMSHLAEDYCAEGPGAVDSMDKDQNRSYLQNFMSAFPDLHFEVLRTVAQDNCVVVDWSATGTHTGPLRTPDGKTISPTHKKAKQFGSTTLECKDGKIRRAWSYFDMAVLMQQLGVTTTA